MTISNGSLVTVPVLLRLRTKVAGDKTGAFLELELSIMCFIVSGSENIMYFMKWSQHPDYGGR